MRQKSPDQLEPWKSQKIRHGSEAWVSARSRKPYVQSTAKTGRVLTQLWPETSSFTGLTGWQRPGQARWGKAEPGFDRADSMQLIRDRPTGDPVLRSVLALARGLGERYRKREEQEDDRQPRVVITQTLSRDLHRDFPPESSSTLPSSIHVRIFFSRWVLRVWTAFSCQVP